jgi:hypothetical protein
MVIFSFLFHMIQFKTGSTPTKTDPIVAHARRIRLSLDEPIS